MLWQYIFLQKDFSPNRAHQQIKKCKPVNRLSSQKASVFFNEKKIISWDRKHDRYCFTMPKKRYKQKKLKR